MDRNFRVDDAVGRDVVALLAEGVDRNLYRPGGSLSAPVALLAEGVDRNSPRLSRASGPAVALLAEGVDRND